MPSLTWAAALLPWAACGAYVRPRASLVSTRFGDDPGHVHALPAFPQYAHSTTALDGWWRYAFSAGAFPAAPDANATAWVPEALPSADPAAPARGFGLLERELPAIPEGHHGRLQFYGCGFSCKVLLDGQQVAEHAGAYTVFYVDVPPGDKHTLRVLVDSRLDGNDLGLNQPKYDFMQYGGILRSVVLHVVPGATMVEGVDVMQGASGKGDATLRFRLHRFDASRDPVHVQVTSDALPAPLELVVDEAHLEHAVDLSRAPRWSPAQPNLAVLNVAVAGAQTGLSVRTGLRTVTACGTPARVCIDAAPVKLLGFCMHNLDAHYRHTVPRESIKKDLEQARDAGANFLRLVHYPHDPLTLELADELGLLLWTETLGWGNSLRDIRSPEFHAQQLAMIDEAVPTTYNHPSVVLYGFLNEGEDFDASACPLYADLAQRYRAWKVGGLVTWASNTYERDQCLEHADVVSFNTYPGWYTGLDQPPSQSVPAELEHLAHFASQAWPQKPLVIAEVGAAAIPKSVPFQPPAGPHAHGGDIGHWSEEYQASVDGAAAEAAVCNERIAGVSLWQLFDTRTGEERQHSRPRGFNNKGVVRDNGERKLAFQAVHDAFTQPCMQRTVML